MFVFRWKYFAITILLLIIEVVIAIFVHDKVIRPYIGDLLVVVLIYCFLRTFLNLSILTAISITLIFSFTVEFFQYLDIVTRLGLEQSRLARIIIGTSFSWGDILMYTVGLVIVSCAEKLKNKSKKKRPTNFATNIP